MADVVHLLRPAAAAQRRERIGPRARALEDVALGVDLALDVAGLPGHAVPVLDLVVVGLEILVGEGPVGDRRALQRRCAVALDGLGAHLEVPREVAPALCHPVDRGASDGVHHRPCGADRARRDLRVVEARGRHLEIRLEAAHPVADVVADLVERVVGLCHARAGLERDHLQPGIGKRPERSAPCGAGPDDHDVGFCELLSHRQGLRVVFLKSL